MKRYGNLFSRLTSFDALYSAFQRASCGSTRTQEWYGFRFHLEEELLKLRDEIKNQNYVPGSLHHFWINDPKKRLISAAPFRDRVVHHALVQVLEPVFEPSFIYDSWATRRGKGTHGAIFRAQSFLRLNRCFLKIDIKQYFASIQPGTLLRLIERKIKDPLLLQLIEVLLMASHEIPGLPIGNMTSQFFANVYLNPLDHLIKDQWQMPGYLRYMDDCVLFHDSLDVLKKHLTGIERFLDLELGLKLNPRATQLNYSAQGLPFLGCRLYPGQIRLKSENKHRYFRRIKNRERQYINGRINEAQLVDSVRSYYALMGHFNTRELLHSSREVTLVGPTA